jgi:enamine deaminase RidA (YjgF/YER057c/UK114 family)
MALTRMKISSGSPWESTFGYSRAVRVGDHAFVGATIGMYAGGSAAAGAYAQARRPLEIIGTALIEAGGTLDDVVATRIFVTDVGDFDEIARAHRELFGTIRPASSMVQISALIDPAYVPEIEADAVIGRGVSPPFAQERPRATDARFG